jgi:hypothetical protein
MTIAIFLLIPAFSFSQIKVNDFDLNDSINAVFIVEVGIFSVNWYINYPGMTKEDRRSKNRLSQVITGLNGSKVEDVNDLEVLNFMERNGWEYVETLKAEFPTGALFRFRKK